MSDAARTLLRRHKVGFVFQRFNLLPTLDTYHNITLAQHIHGNGFDPHRFEVVAGPARTRRPPAPQALGAFRRRTAARGARACHHQRTENRPGR